MSYLKRIELDEEARRYLKHYEVFEGTRTRALSYLDQVWHALAMTLRKLSKQPHYAGMKVELLGGASTHGVKWSGLVNDERVYLELSDVRAWPSMSGVWVGCALGAEGRSARELIRARVHDQAVHDLLPEALREMSGPLTFGLESDRQLCLPLPLSARPPSEEAQSLLGYGLSLWGLLNEDLAPRAATSPSQRGSAPSIAPLESASEPTPSTRRDPEPLAALEPAHEATHESVHEMAHEAEDELTDDPYGYGFYQEEPAEQPNELEGASSALVDSKASRRRRALGLLDPEPEAPEPTTQRVEHQSVRQEERREERREERQDERQAEPLDERALERQAEHDAERRLLEEARGRLGRVTPLERPLKLDDDDLYPISQDSAAPLARGERRPLRPRPSGRRGRARSVSPPRLPEGKLEQMSADELEEQLQSLSKEEMIALIAEQRRAQQSPRSAQSSPPQPRVIGGVGGRRDLSAVTGEAERFIPKRLEDPPPSPRRASEPSTQAQELVAPQAEPSYPSVPFTPPPQRAYDPQSPSLPEPSAPTQGYGAEPALPLGAEASADELSPQESAHQGSQGGTSEEQVLIQDELSAPAREEASGFEPSYSPQPPVSPAINPAMSPPAAPVIQQGAQVQLFSQDDDVAPPSYIKDMQRESHELDIFTQALARCGLPPWRINSYADGRGKIIWLSNGAHIDIDPEGVVTLGGESQDDTRARLARVGITFS